MPESSAGATNGALLPSTPLKTGGAGEAWGGGSGGRGGRGNLTTGLIWRVGGGGQGGGQEEMV